MDDFPADLIHLLLGQMGFYPWQFYPAFLGVQLALSCRGLGCLQEAVDGRLAVAPVLCHLRLVLFICKIISLFLCNFGLFIRNYNSPTLTLENIYLNFSLRS